MEDSIKSIQLVVKTGWLFANCDGVYDDSEKEFINIVIDEALNNPVLLAESKENPVFFDELKASLYKLVDTEQSFECVVAETNSLLNSLNAEDHKMSRGMLYQFIESLIGKDGNVSKEETELLKKWELMVK